LRSVEFLLILACAASAAQAAPPARKASAAKPAARAPAETVFVAVAPPAAPAKENRGSESSRDTDARRTESAFATGPTRNYAQAFGANVGFYAAEVLGTNPYMNLNWDLYPEGQAFFFQFTSGIGSVQSDFAESIIGGTQTPHSFMIAGEALGGYTLSGLLRGDGRSGGLFPYFVGGITAVWQGGIPNIGAVLGFGNRMSVPFFGKNTRYALNYGVRDHIYSQKLKTDPSVTQNFALLVGVQKYF
jgi:hypothetical protein